MGELQIIDFDGPFGAEVRGVTGLDVLDTASEEQLRRAFDERQLLVFRDLDPDPALQARLTEIVIRIDTSQDEDGIRDVEEQAGSWVSNRVPGAAGPFGRLHFHSDAMWSSVAIEGLSLYAVEAEPPAVPTLFASTTHAWDTLPAELREQVDGHEAVHIAGQARRADDEDGDVLVAVPKERRSVTTPIAHRHPRTGRTMLYISEQVTHDVVGLSPEQSEDLLKPLFAHLYDPTNLVSHEWRTGDLALWDNIALQHGRPNVDLDGPARTLRKCVRPVEASRAAMQAFAYAPETTDS
jgi:taurine dioxygenase